MTKLQQLYSILSPKF